MSKSEKQYPCTYKDCKAKFSRPDKLKLHLYTHTGERPFKCGIDGCDRSYTTPTHLKRHENIKHLKVETKTMCRIEDCGKIFSNQSNMERHVKRAHDTNRVYKYTCNECHQSFPKKLALRKHSYNHTGEHYYKCDECGDSFESSKLLTKHKRTHVVYECKICLDTYPTWSLLMEHQRMKHKKVCLYSCNKCNYKAKKKILLAQHMQTHIPVGRRTLYKCSYAECNRLYLYKRNLNWHVKTYHKGIKLKVICPEVKCGAVLSKNVCLQNHIRKRHSDYSAFVFPKPRRMRKDCGKMRKKDVPFVTIHVPPIKC